MATNGTVRKGGKPKGAPKSGGGSRAGKPNKATADARKAIAAFVDGNAHRLTGWLDQVADGIMQPDGEKFAVDPNPAKAFEMFQSVVEYHIPKLARTESSVKHSGVVGLNVNVNFD